MFHDKQTMYYFLLQFTTSEALVFQQLPSKHVIQISLSFVPSRKSCNDVLLKALWQLGVVQRSISIFLFGIRLKNPSMSPQNGKMRRVLCNFKSIFSYGLFLELIHNIAKNINFLQIIQKIDEYEIDCFSVTKISMSSDDFIIKYIYLCHKNIHFSMLYVSCVITFTCDCILDYIKTPIYRFLALQVAVKQGNKKQSSSILGPNESIWRHTSQVWSNIKNDLIILLLFNNNICFTCTEYIVLIFNVF